MCYHIVILIFAFFVPAVALAADSQELILKTSAPQGLRVVDRCELVVSSDYNQLEITFEESASSAKRVNRSMEKRIDDLLWRLNKKRGQKSEITSLGRDLQKVGSGYQLKASYQLNIPVAVGLDDIYKALERDGNIKHQPLVQFVSEGQKDRAIKKCYNMSGKRILARAKSLAHQLKVRVSKLPVAVEGQETFVTKKSQGGSYLQLEMVIETRFELIKK
jgi:uncharacterized protein YggE